MSTHHMHPRCVVYRSDYGRLANRPQGADRTRPPERTMTGNWAGSNRRRTLPPDWHAIRKRILQRDGHRCTWTGDGIADATGYIPVLPRCTERATDVDHVGAPDDDRPQMLRSLCSAHHDQRSSKQGNAARAARQRLRLRPVELHPGLKR